jgi:hypothetical protein
MLPSDVLMHIRRFLRNKIAIWTLEAGRLTAFVSQMCRQTALFVVHAFTVYASELLYAPLILETILRVCHQHTGCTET